VSRRISSILFICTGNIFRSMVAEHALKAYLGEHSGYLVGSAGIDASPQTVHPFLRGLLLARGVDVTAHIQRRLTQTLLDETALPVAMSLDHRDIIRQRFGREVRLFNEVSYGRESAILDLHEVLPDWRESPDAAKAYVTDIVEYIWGAIPSLVERIPRYMAR
jgi:protein-tyrosine phosphatase